MNELFNQLFKEVFDSISVLQNLDGFDIKTEKTPNGIIITAQQKPEPKVDEELEKYIEDFQLYVKNADNFIFDDAVKMYSEIAKVKLPELDKIIKEKKDKEAIMKNCEIFKNCIKAVAQDFVDELVDKYEL